ncbi:hypothetical protein [Micromonospora sp. NPDC005413]|uniref:hypothetical protein n=1 Tax=Micromonospora sp. NPDC005413 TaxID=3154563 RepID=UPI0033BB5507
MSGREEPTWDRLDARANTTVTVLGPETLGPVTDVAALRALAARVDLPVFGPGPVEGRHVLQRVTAGPAAGHLILPAAVAAGRPSDPLGAGAPAGGDLLAQLANGGEESTLGAAFKALVPDLVNQLATELHAHYDMVVENLGLLPPAPRDGVPTGRRASRAAGSAPLTPSAGPRARAPGPARVRGRERQARRGSARGPSGRPPGGYASVSSRSSVSQVRPVPGDCGRRPGRVPVRQGMRA